MKNDTKEKETERRGTSALTRLLGVRDIKFRAWDIEKQQMMYPTVDGYFKRESGTKFQIDANVKCNPVYLEEIIIVKPILMRFTGKKDVKGKEIYEGDIIEFNRREWGGDDNIHLVTWNNTSAEWDWGGGSTGDMEWRTVIGNIFETPELIEEIEYI